ncbi:MAG: hypothetical protein CV087_04580 [Candidatus Brocadia sp. WS118]|nr:MAG: hypothetical protein CV087_04580 [Candidatus Brocadia sp. WS118]
MDTKNVYVRGSFFILLGGLFAALLGACSYCPPTATLCGLIPDSPITELTSEDRSVVFEEPGTIIVHHGFGCAESKKSETQDVLRVEQSLDIPSYATNATVFLNGWHLQYLHKDHKVAGIGTLIRNIRLEGQTLKWEAHGALSDDNFDDAYSWCYHYTVVAWNPSNMNLVVDHKDGCDASDPRETNFFAAVNDETTTALSSFPTFLQNRDFTASRIVAILPRGFAFRWGKGLTGSCDIDDNKMLHIGYDMDHSEIFIEQGKKYKKKFEDVVLSLPNSASLVDSGFVSWETSAIYKDNKARRDYTFGEMVSGLGGSDVGIIQPPFSILPVEDENFCTGIGTSPQTEEFVIEKVPFEFAIPMLTGWELAYPCSGNEKVTEAGISIDEWSYDRNTRTLRYKLSSVLRDKDTDPGFNRSHKVTVLGFKAVSGGIPSAKSPDLVPFSPTGTDPSAFCRFEEGGKLLRVSVKNQGNEHAAASKTTVLFNDVPVILDTPAIPAGGSVDLLFKVPSNCFSPDCSFKITVDSNNQVNELNSEGNNSANGLCIG